MAEPARPGGRAPVGPHPHPTPVGAVSALGDLRRRLLSPPGADAFLGPPALGPAAASLDPRRAGLFRPGQRPPDAVDRLDAASRPLQKPLDHAALGRPGGAARLLAGPTGDGGCGTQRALEDRALTQLRAWLPARRRVLLIGDRGFRGRDRMHLLKRLRLQFILRVTGDTMVEIQGEWVRLRDVAPAVGQRRQWAQRPFGQEKPQERLTVNLIAVRQALPEPKSVLTNKGKKTVKTVDETIWFLATDLPLSTDAVALYQTRMQIEQSFRDSKGLLGLERERTQQPWVRLRTLLWALMIGYTLDLQLGGAAPAVAPRPPRVALPGDAAPPVGKPEYRAQSATREGLHALVLQLVLGDTPLAAAFREMAEKSERMRARPQVQNRRRPTPALRCRTRRAKNHVHA